MADKEPRAFFSSFAPSSKGWRFSSSLPLLLQYLQERFLSPLWQYPDSIPAGLCPSHFPSASPPDILVLLSYLLLLAEVKTPIFWLFYAVYTARGLSVHQNSILWMENGTQFPGGQRSAGCRVEVTQKWVNSEGRKAEFLSLLFTWGNGDSKRSQEKHSLILGAVFGMLWL